MYATLRRIAAGLAVVIVVSAVVAFGLTISFGRSGRVCRDVVVSGIRLGGLTRSQAKAKIGQWAAERVKRPVTLTALDARWTGTVAELGGHVDIRGTLNRAMAVGRQGNIFHRAVCVLTPWGSGKRFGARLVTDNTRLRKTIAELAYKIDRPHKDARLFVVKDRLEIKPEGFGIKVNQDKAVLMVSRALSSGLSVIGLPIEVDKPDVTTEDAAKIDTLLSRFTTSFNPAKRGRTHNLRLAANAINGIVLKPGMRFSTNEAVGPRLMSRGFQAAPIFVRGKLEEGLGGGVCQVSTTLYNAVLLAGLNVKKRGHHARPVKYVAPGRDATVVWGYVDLVFANDRDFPIYIQGEVKGRRLIFRIFGRKDFDEIRVFSDVERKADGTIIAKTYRAIKKGDDNLTELISTDIYKPLPKKKSPMSFSPHLKMQMEEITD
ncbi:MAG: VanW family protein [Armatimonadetes bacterium]|nr:VanW family protein [Armatimonadota bacterium]